MKRPLPARLRALLLGLVLAAPFAARADIDLVFQGNKEFSAFALRERLPEEPAKADDDEVAYWGEEAAYEIEQAYLQIGFFQVVVKARTERTDPKDKDWRVTFSVTEGPRYRYGPVRVVVSGDSLNPQKRPLQAREGDLYREEDIVRDVRDLTRAFGNSGYVRAEIHENVVLQDSQALARVDYNVDPGLPVVFGALKLSIRRVRDDSLRGLTRGNLLRDLVPYRPGDTVRADENDKVIEKLQTTGQYNSVRLDDTLMADGRSLVILDVEEKVPGNAHGSVFYETQYGFGVSAGVKHSNVAGTLNEVRADASLAQNKQGLVLGYGSPLTLGMLLRFDNDFAVETFQDKLPDEPMFGGDLRVTNNASLSRGFSYWLRGLAGAEVEYKSLLVSDSTGTLSRESGGLLNFTATGLASFLDQPLNPSRGARFTLTLGNGGPIYERGSLQIFSDRHNWFETKTAAYYYQTPVTQLKVAGRFDGGRFFGAGGQNAERFFLGGPRSVRSYGFRQLCPDQEAPARGSCPLTENAIEPAYVLFSGELRVSPFDFAFFPSRGFPGFFKPLEFVPFFDLGKVWNLQGEGTPSMFSREFFAEGPGRGLAYGGGIRYPLLGIFNFRLDFAWGRPGPGKLFGLSGDNVPDQWVVDLAQAF